MTINRKLQKVNDTWFLLRNPQVTRIGDARREQVTDKLNDAFVAGFITKEECDKRTEIVLSSKYEHEMFWALDDLPDRIPLPRKQEMSAQELAEQDWPFRKQDEDDRVYWWIVGIALTIAMILVVLGVISMATH